MFLTFFNFKEEVKMEPVSMEKIETMETIEVMEPTEVKGSMSPPQMDHDYATLYTLPGAGGMMKQESGKAWIEQDAPPMVSTFISFHWIKLSHLIDLISLIKL
jgi:hypothetical protein